MLRLTHLIWNIVYSLRASSPIYASEASRSSTRELAAKQQEAESLLARRLLFVLNVRFVNRNYIRHNDVIDLTRNVGSLTWRRYPVLRDVPLEFAPAAYHLNTAKGPERADSSQRESFCRVPVIMYFFFCGWAAIPWSFGPLCRLESFWFSATSGTVMLVISFLSLLYLLCSVIFVVFG